MKNSTLKIIKQKLELLELKPEFQKEVSNFRKRWNIPNSGFKSSESHRSWWEDLVKNSDRYFNSDEFNKKTKEVGKKKRKALKDGDVKVYQDCEKLNKEINLSIPLNGYRNDLTIFLEKFSLSNHFKKPIEGYLLSGDFSSGIFKLSDFNLIIKTERGDDKNKARLYLEIFSDTTTKDIQKAWPLIKSLKKKLIGYKDGRRKLLPEFSRNKRILELSQAGKNNKEIKEIIKKEFNKTLIYYEINKIKSELKKKIKDV